MKIDKEIFDLVDDLFAEEKAEQVRKTKDFQDQMTVDFKNVMANPSGLRLFWWLLSETHIFHCNFTGRSNDTLFREGQRFIGITLLKQMLNVDADILSKMLAAQKEVSNNG